ncbi:MAG: hypothetical protein PHE24_01105 [Patescibacteria group bacterium]|nr:hypothetical protein [Patescibacteria group bacterium]
MKRKSRPSISDFFGGNLIEKKNANKIKTDEKIEAKAGYLQ